MNQLHSKNNLILSLFTYNYRSLGRKYVRIALGGDRDTSTLKGFRRTYVGAIPGKIVRALKTAEVENPVILIDEVDKLG